MMNKMGPREVHVHIDMTNHHKCGVRAVYHGTGLLPLYAANISKVGVGLCNQRIYHARSILLRVKAEIGGRGSKYRASLGRFSR